MLMMLREKTCLQASNRMFLGLGLVALLNLLLLLLLLLLLQVSWQDRPWMHWLAAAVREGTWEGQWQQQQQHHHLLLLLLGRNLQLEAQVLKVTRMTTNQAAAAARCGHGLPEGLSFSCWGVMLGQGQQQQQQAATKQHCQCESERV
jgi:hypothetical protein